MTANLPLGQPRVQTQPLVQRMTPFTSTVFAEMSALATRTGAINLGQGFPDTDGPAGMLAAAVQAIGDGQNQYPPGPGMPALREAVSRQRQQRYGTTYDPDTEVLITVGATEAIAAALLALCEAGDEVIVLEPYYDSYAAAIALAGAVRRPVTMRPSPVDGRFTFDADELRAAVTRRTRLVLLNSPHNPTGTVLTRDELTVVADLCREHDLLAVTDEVYEYLVYDDAEHIALSTLDGMRERTVAISSAGKTFSATGWKIGWVCAPAPLVAAVRAVKQFLTYVASGPFQLAAAHALTYEHDWVGEQRISLQRKRDRLSAGLSAAGLTVHPSAGTYFVQTDIRPLGLTSASDLAWALPERIGVAAIPTSVFYDDATVGEPFLRFAFCKRDEVLDEACTRLQALAR